MDCDECEAHMKDAIFRSERVKNLLNKVRENESATNLKMTVLDCSSNAFLQNCRAYTADPPLEIVLCANSLKDRDEVEVALLYLIVLAFILQFLIKPTLSLSWSRVITGWNSRNHLSYFPFFFCVVGGHCSRAHSLLRFKS